MATKNAPYYSMKFNRADTIKSHKTKETAMKSARDFGMIYETESDTEFQVHAMSNNTLKAFNDKSKGYRRMDFKMKTALEKEQLITI